MIRDLPLLASNFRNQQSLSDYLKQHNIVGIADIDTRKLTRLLREKGAQNGCIVAGDSVDEALALVNAQDFPGLKGMDLAKEVTTQESYSWTQGSWQLHQGLPDALPDSELPYHVVAYDFGAKRNILRMLVDRGCRLTVVPATTPADEVLAMNPDGVFLSNGPGDPAPCDYAIAATQTFLAKGVPLFGICLGHQILALASGAKTVKMKFGHHGANHPVKDLDRDVVMITSQNHALRPIKIACQTHCGRPMCLCSMAAYKAFIILKNPPLASKATQRQVQDRMMRRLFLTILSTLSNNIAPNRSR